MAVNTTLYGLSQTPSSNGPDGASDPPSSLDDVGRYQGSFIALLRDGAHQYVASIAGTNTITGTLTPAPTAYITGGLYRFIVGTTNTGAVTLNVNSLGARAITKRGVGLLAAGDLVVGSAVEVFYDGAQFQLISPPAPLPGALYGMTLANNAVDATNDIDVSAGSCVDSTGSVMIVGSAMTKRLDAAWAAGTGNGGRLSAAAIADGTYHYFAIYKDSDGSGDYGFDVSPTAPTMPSGYTKFRRIGSVLRESGALVAFTQRGDQFMRSVPIADYNAPNPGTGATSLTLSVPNGIVVEAMFSVTFTDSTPATATVALFTALTQADTDPGAGTGTLQLRIPAAGAGVPANDTATLEVYTNTARQIRRRLSASTADHSMNVTTFGWNDARDRT